MSNMNNYNNYSPDATPASKADMESEHDFGLRRMDGDEELGDQNHLQRYYITVQEPSNTFQNRLQWLSDTKGDREIKWDYIANNNFTGRAVLHIFGELLSGEKKEKKEEKNEEKKEEKNEGKKEKHKGKEEEKNKRKKEAKKEGKREGIHGTRVIRTRVISTPGPVSKLDEDSRASSQLHKTSSGGECVLEDHSPKNNSSLFRSISDISKHGRQNSLGNYPAEKRFVHFPTKSEWNDKSKSNKLGIWELFRNDPLDSSIQVEAQSSDQNAHNQCANKRKDKTLSELQNLPGYICEQLDKHNRLGFHQITEKDRDSLEFVDAEYIEYLNEKFEITGVRPVFIDYSGFVIWFLDKDGNMYEWDEMQQILRYMGKDLIDGLKNNFIYPEKICEVMEGTGERIPVMEFARQMEERAEKIWNNREIVKNK